MEKESKKAGKATGLVPATCGKKGAIKMKKFIGALERAGFIDTDKNAVPALWLASRVTGNGHLPGVILDGPPGVGKTFLSEK